MTHEFDGKKYKKASAHQKEWGAKLISKLHLNGSEQVLDLGCGDGDLTSHIAEIVPNGYVLGIDGSQGMIDVAQSIEGRNLHFRKMDINDLDFVNKFDVVFSNATLHWVKDHHRLLQNVHRALRPGGRLRFQFAGDGNCASFFSTIREATMRDEFREFFSVFEWPWYTPSVNEYQKLVDSSRLRDVSVWGQNRDRFFPDTEMMIRWIDQPSLVPLFRYVVGPKKELFRDFVISRMIERTKQEDGRCFETFRRINLSAVK